jgi:hypothetical protein
VNGCTNIFVLIGELPSAYKEGEGGREAWKNLRRRPRQNVVFKHLLKNQLIIIRRYNLF